MDICIHFLTQDFFDCKENFIQISKIEKRILLIMSKNWQLNNLYNDECNMGKNDEGFLFNCHYRPNMNEAIRKGIFIFARSKG